MKVNFEVKRVHIKLLVAFLVVALVSSMVTYSYAASSASTFTISGGQYPGAPSYTIYSVGSTYYAKDQFGAVSWSSTNATTLLQNTLDATPVGGSVLVTCSLSINTVYINSYRSLISNNAGNVISVQASGAGHGLIVNGTQANPARKVIISGLSFSNDGYTSNCLTLNYAQYDCLFNNLYFYVAPSAVGMYIYGGSYAFTISNILMVGTSAGGSGNYGIMMVAASALDTVNSITIENCRFRSIEKQIDISY